MSDDKTTEPEAKTSVPSPDEEPKQASAKPAGAKPATRKIAPGSVVSGEDTDPIKYSSARPSYNKRVLTVLHLQRRLVEEGFVEAASAPGGHYETLTTRSVQQYQQSLDAEPTGVLTREQFAGLFEGDPNVTVSIDTPADHTV
jgi:hypothetical protein